MILDKGIFTLFRRTDAAGPGHKPVYDYTLMGKGWYGELDFETAPSRETEGRKALRIDARIRILQRREIRQLRDYLIRICRGHGILAEE